MTLTPVLAEFARERDTYREFFLARTEWQELLERANELDDGTLEDAVLRLANAHKACEILEGIRGATS